MAEQPTKPAASQKAKAASAPKKTAPVVKTQAFEAAEKPLAQPGVVTFDEDNNQETTDSVIAVHSDMVGFNEKAERLAFMEELVQVMIHEDQNANDDPQPYVFLSVNGEGPMPNKVPWVPRGVPINIKRKFVERLARAKRETVKSVEKVNAQGERYIEYPKHASLQYPFSVLRDDNPRGATWLTQVLSERT